MTLGMPRRVLRCALGAGAAALLAAAPTAALAGEAPAAPVPPTAARVATFNIHAGAGGDNVFDLERTAAAIAALDADVVGLQEVDLHWGARSGWQDTLSELGHRLGMETAFAPIYDLDPPAADQPRRQYGVGLLSRHPIIAVENHDLTRLSTQEADPVPAPAPGFLEATVQIRGARTHVYVTHLDYRGDPTVRSLQVADTLRILGDDPAGANQALLGDFNAGPQAGELQPLWGPLQDAWAVAPDREGAPGRTYPAAAPTKRIDFVTTSRNTTVLRAQTLDDPAHVGASDHRAVVATVLLNQGSESSR
jgi:endonuclease/exonuclease/phosphatase family metal-dependent hydrolase